MLLPNTLHAYDHIFEYQTAFEIDILLNGHTGLHCCRMNLGEYIERPIRLDDAPGLAMNFRADHPNDGLDVEGEVVNICSKNGEGNCVICRRRSSVACLVSIETTRKFRKVELRSTASCNLVKPSASKW